MKSKKIAICSVQVPFVRGGAERLVESLYKEMIKSGLNVELINIPFKWYPASRLVTECIIWRLLDISESNGEKIDMVIATKFPSTVVKHPDKRIWLIHQERMIYDLYGTEMGDLEYTKEHHQIREMMINIDNITIPEAKKIFTISKNVSKRLKKFNNIDSLHLYPPPANRERFYNEGYGDYILYVGRLDPKKRIKLLIEAIKSTRTKVKCLVAGTGPNENSLRQTIHDLALDNKIQLLGYLPDNEVLKLYANALAVYYAPYDEDYGFSTVEAFLSRKPIITTIDSGGVLEFVKDGENGFVVNANPMEIAEKIDRLFEHKEVCHKMGANGYELVKEITWDRVIERLVD